MIFSIVVIGSENVGKSSIANIIYNYLKESENLTPFTVGEKTYSVEWITMKYKNCFVSIYDTPAITPDITSSENLGIKNLWIKDLFIELQNQIVIPIIVESAKSLENNVNKKLHNYRNLMDPDIYDEGNFVITYCRESFEFVNHNLLSISDDIQLQTFLMDLKSYDLFNPVSIVKEIINKSIDIKLKRKKRKKECLLS